MTRRGLTPARAAALCLAASAVLLVTVHVFDAFGYVPCPLCLHQREVHWLALGVAAAALLLSVRPVTGRMGRIALVALALVYIGSAVLAGYHAGVEYHWWPAPPCEAAGTIASGDDLLASLSRPSRAVPCDEAAWRLFGISLAGYNFLMSLLLAAVAAAGVLSRPRGKFFR